MTLHKKFISCLKSLKFHGECSNYAYKIRERNLTNEYTLTRNKILILARFG